MAIGLLCSGAWALKAARRQPLRTTHQRLCGQLGDWIATFSTPKVRCSSHTCSFVCRFCNRVVRHAKLFILAFLLDGNDPPNFPSPEHPSSLKLQLPLSLTNKRRFRVPAKHQPAHPRPNRHRKQILYPKQLNAIYEPWLHLRSSPHRRSW
jgi:hypothetical protein